MDIAVPAIFNFLQHCGSENFDSTLSRCDTILDRDRRTDGQKPYDSKYHHAGNNTIVLLVVIIIIGLLIL